MKVEEVLSILIRSNGGSLRVNKYTIIQQDFNLFLVTTDSGGFYCNSEEALNYLNS